MPIELIEPSFEMVFLSSIREVDAEKWNALVEADYPFLRHEFLCALEDNNCVSKASGWTPQHYALYQGQDLVAAAPLYIKAHSFGEYVFDWSWANAYADHGLDYYPKLVCAIPFTPCVGPRLMCRSPEERGLLEGRFLTDVLERCEDQTLSSLHILFPEETFSAQRLKTRSGVQFHWYNKGYSSYADFLETMTSRKRKAFRKERRLISEAGLCFRWVTGYEAKSSDVDAFYSCYQATYLKKRGELGYLNKPFFEQLVQEMPENLRLLFAEQEGEVVASCLFFVGTNTLYGRYWGCLREVEYLHFEACYYQGIEYCIEQGLTHFDAGAQGEHKVVRGFEPISTYSYHWIAHEGFSEAIARFVEQERPHVEAYQAQVSSLLPYKNS